MTSVLSRASDSDEIVVSLQRRLATLVSPKVKSPTAVAVDGSASCPKQVLYEPVVIVTSRMS